MGCDCGKPKCDGHCGVSPAVLQINNPSECVLFHRVEVPASMGDSKTNPPKNGEYKNVLLYYEADQTSWLYSSDGVPQKLVNGVTNYEDAINLPQINGVTLLGNKSLGDLGITDAIDDAVAEEKAEREAADEALGDEIDDINDELLSRAVVFDTVADMKAATNLVNGSYAQTLGFHTINDGGGALYKITNTGTANEMNVIAIGSLFANLIYGSEINVKQFGAYGDGTHDDLTAIQASIDYARSHDHYTVYIPHGNYNVTNAIKVPEMITVNGDTVDTTKIIKSTNNLDAEENVDAVIIFYKTPDYSVAYTQRQQLHRLSIEGNNSNEYGIYCSTASPRVHIDRCNVSKVNLGVKLASGWVFAITNTSVQPNVTGFDIRDTSTTLDMQGTYVYGGTGYGYYLRGVSYSSFNNVACDENTNVPYHFEYCNIDISGLGCECDNANKSIEANQSHVNINNATIIVNSTSSAYRCIDVAAYTELKFKSAAFIIRGSHDSVAGTFIYAGTKSNLSFENCKMDKPFDTDNHYADSTTTVRISNKDGEYVYNAAPHTPALGNVLSSANNDDFTTKAKLGTYTGAIIFNNLANPRYTIDSYDRRWTPAHNMGDIFVNQAPAINGIAFFQQITDPDNHAFVGTITAVNISDGTGTITMSSLALEEPAQSRGVLLRNSSSITSSSGGKGTISTFNTGSNTISLTSVTGTFAVGDTVTLNGRTTYNASLFSNIQSIGYGITANRPSSPVNGYMYYDTSLGKPTWYVNGNWKDATGTNV